MKKMLFLLMILLVLSGCSSKIEKEILISAADSLGWQEATEYHFTNPIEIKIIDNKLYVVDMALSEIKIFDPQTMKYISTLGKKGIGPGEFSSPISICKYENETLAINEIGNFRTQILSINGEYVKKINFSGQWKLSAFDDHCYTNILPFTPGVAGIYEIKSDSLTKVLDLDEWIKTQNLPKFPKNFFSFSSFEEFHIVSFLYSPKILMIDKQGKIADIEFEPIKFVNENTNLGQAMRYKKGFIIPANSYNENKKSETDTKLIYYNFEGSIEKIFHLSDLKIFVYETAAISGNEVFLINDAVIYKYVLK